MKSSFLKLRKKCYNYLHELYKEQEILLDYDIAYENYKAFHSIIISEDEFKFVYNAIKRHINAGYYNKKGE